MDRKELETKIIECISISYEKPVESLTVETNFKTDLAGASIQMVGLVSLIENELDVLVQLPVAAACVTVGDLVDRVEELL